MRVLYSGVNYKDGLASIPEGKIVRRYPFIPGIDLAGTVVHSAHADYKEGDSVLCTGYELGVSHEGGFSQYARIKGEWLVRRRACLRVMRWLSEPQVLRSIIDRGLDTKWTATGTGAVLVTGQQGRGRFAVSILSQLCYRVTASTGKSSQRDWLLKLGAHEVITREEARHPPRGRLCRAMGGSRSGRRKPTGFTSEKRKIWRKRRCFRYDGWRCF